MNSHRQPCQAVGHFQPAKKLSGIRSPPQIPGTFFYFDKSLEFEAKTAFFNYECHYNKMVH